MIRGAGIGLAAVAAAALVGASAYGVYLFFKKPVCTKRATQYFNCNFAFMNELNFVSTFRQQKDGSLLSG